MYNDGMSKQHTSLYRISLKCLIENSTGDVLVVKESGRDFWDLPGGGMDHGEDIHAAIARELNEEVGFTGRFNYTSIAIEDPVELIQNLWQIRIILHVQPESFDFRIGNEADEIQFMDARSFKDTHRTIERKIYEYWALHRA